VCATCSASHFPQGAFILNNPTLATQAFYYSIPGPLFWPMVVLSTAATIVASQSIISGSFSVVSQAVQLQVLPRMQIIPKSRCAPFD
jgi:KUP system potassium uptake protein